MRSACACLVLVASVAFALPARAFVRKLDKSGHAIWWRESCVPVTVYLNGLDKGTNASGQHVTVQLTAPGIIKSVTAAAHAWSTDTVTCADGSSPSLEIVPTFAPFDAKPPAIAYDAKNSIVFRTEFWAKSGVPGGMRDYDANGLAITTVTSEGDGHLTDVDIEINATNPLLQWMNLDPGVVPPGGDTASYYDLQDELTHEFGHFIGLDHTCFIPDTDGSNFDALGHMRPKDDMGQDIPNCKGAPSKVQTTVMFNTSPPMETSKRYLADDDIRGVCTIYPASRATEVCTLDQAPAGCAVSRPARSKVPYAAGALVVAAAALAAARHRRVRARARARS
jgi:hypothetical protein